MRAALGRILVMSRAAAAACIEVITSSNDPSDPHAGRQGHRLVGASDQTKKRLRILLVGLGNCRERQERYDEAKTLYESVIKQGTRNAAASPNTNRMIATSYNNLAWLLALKDDQGKDALVDIDHAIKLAGRLARLSRHSRCHLPELETDTGRHQRPRNRRQGRSFTCPSYSTLHRHIYKPTIRKKPSII